MSELLYPQQPIDLQIAAVEAVGQADDPDVAPFLLEEFATYSPKLQAAVLDAVFRQQSRLPQLLDAVEQGRVQRSCLDAARREQLLRSSSDSVAERARRLLGGAAESEERRMVLENYQEALRLPRDGTRGQAVFARQCSKCHKLGDEGYEVGPDLRTARTRADETILSDILDPSNQITVGYSSYNVITENGRIFSGVLAGETATSIVLRAEENKESVILRRDIDEMTMSSVSMMPEKLEQEVSLQDAADLLGFLRQSLGSRFPDCLVLFDEDVQFAAQLDEGLGRARIESDDRYRGDVALAIAPPQRFSSSIRDWQFRIAEHPGPEEYRYLRFAWRQQTGNGVMLELAADGSWPRADESRLRYFAGTNTTAWQATRISDRRPDQWTLVTCDLWKDFGAFTLTGIAPTAMGGEALFDGMELLRTLEASNGKTDPQNPR